MSLEFKKISGSTPYFLNSASTAEELTIALEDYMRTGAQIIFTHDGEDCILSSFEYKTGIESTVIAYFVTPKKKLLKVDTAAGFDLVVTESDITPDIDITWENLQDKPFGEIKQDIGDTVTWDGNLDTFKGVVTNTIMVDNMSVCFVKVSDSVPSYKDIGSNSTMNVIFANTNIENMAITKDTTLDDGIITFGTVDFEPIYVITTDNLVTNPGIVFPEKGVYFMNMVASNGVAYLVGTSLTIPNYNFVNTTLKKIDEKYLPDYKAMIDEAIGNAIGGSY
jgi:hypothetical protein